MKKILNVITANKRATAVLAAFLLLFATAGVRTLHSSSAITTDGGIDQTGLYGTTVAQSEQAIATRPSSKAALKEKPGPAEAAADHAPNGLEGDPYHPVQGTWTVNLAVVDGKLVSGPATVEAKVGSYVLFLVTDNRENRSFFIDELGMHAEVEDADEGGGTAYLKLDRAGSFKYGIRDQANPNDSQVLGTLTVSQ
jgi:plastocyanin